MIESVSLASLIDRLARPSFLPSLTSSAIGIAQPASDPEGFVPPGFRRREESAESPAVVLVSAPAAVGKSWLSRHVSAVTGNPHWDLSEFRVGSNFFVGTIVKSYGGMGFAQLDDAISNDDLTLVIDAADEALVRAGTANFEAALQDLSSLLGSDERIRPAVVLFGRPETMDLAAVILSEAGILWEGLDVDYFDESAARSLVRAKVGSRPGHATNADVDDMLSAFFGAALAALGPGGWDAHRSFLGYSPVLDALAEFARTPDNPHADLTALLDDRGDARFWELMAEIVSGICARETDRFVRTFGESDPVRRTAARDTFTLDQQLRALLDVSSASGAVVPSESTPDWLRESIVEAADRQLSEHPFMRRASDRSHSNALLRFGSPVFRDFAMAWALRQGERRLHEQIEYWASDPALNPTPMCFRFLSISVATGDFLLSGAAIPVLAQSAASASDERLAVTVRAHSSVGRGANGDELVLADGSAAPTAFGLRLGDDETIRLPRMIANIEVDAPGGTVDLGGAIRDLSLGPDVTISARSIRVTADDVRVVGRPGRPSVEIDCEGLTSSTVRLRVFEGAQLRVSAPSLYFPWQRHAAPTVKAASEGSILDAAVELRRVLRRFNRRSLAGRLTYPRDAVETVLRKGRMSRSMFEYCLARGVIVPRGEAYAFVEPPGAAVVERVDVEDANLRGFLRSYLEWVSLSE